MCVGAGPWLTFALRSLRLCVRQLVSGLVKNENLTPLFFYTEETVEDILNHGKKGVLWGRATASIIRSLNSRNKCFGGQ